MDRVICDGILSGAAAAADGTAETESVETEQHANRNDVMRFRMVVPILISSCDMDDIIMRGAALNSLPLLPKIWVKPSRAHGYLAKVT